jgi:hypothetical protein
MSLSDLPPYLHNTEPMEVEDLPLQVALLTMEAAAMRSTLTETALTLESMGRLAGHLAKALSPMAQLLLSTASMVADVAAEAEAEAEADDDG